MRILQVDSQPFHEIPYSSAASGGGVDRRLFPLLRGRVDALPGSLEALFVCSDLQGVIDHRIDGRPTIEPLGVVLAEELAYLAAEGRVPEASSIGVLLCGDLYTLPGLEKRGGSGDARPVWNEFAGRFRWVAGVAGNHDTFGSNPAEQKAFASRPGIHLLDGSPVDLDGLRIAGVGGIIGDPARPQRKTEKDFVRSLKRQLEPPPDLLLLHLGPDVPELKMPGHEVVRSALHRAKVGIVLCGHVHWKTPLAELPYGIQVLNVDSRGVLLMR